MEIVPEPRSILDLIYAWHSPRACPASSPLATAELGAYSPSPFATGTYTPPPSPTIACPYFVPDRWILPGEARPPSFDLCPDHMIEIMPAERHDEIRRGVALIADIRSALQLALPHRPELLWLHRSPLDEEEPVTLYGFDVDNDAPKCRMSAFFIRGTSRVSAKQLMSLSTALGRPHFFAYDSVDNPAEAEVLVWMASALTHLDVPAYRLVHHWDRQNPYGGFAEVQKSPGLLTPQQRKEVDKAWDTFLGKPDQGGRPLGRTIAMSDIDLACKILLTQFRNAGNENNPTQGVVAATLGCTPRTIRNVLRDPNDPPVYQSWNQFIRQGRSITR